MRLRRGLHCIASGRAGFNLTDPYDCSVFAIDSELKPVYHAGGVLACNYLVALIEAALRAHEKAGIPRSASLKALEPMVRETVDTIFQKGPDKARSAAWVTNSLQHLLVDPDFAGVRGPEALAKLPEAERQPWQQLWGDVAATLARAQGKNMQEK